MEHLLAEISRRCLRNATRARRVLGCATERNDEKAIASAHADLVFSRAVARAVINRLEHLRQLGEISDMAVARIGHDLATTLRLVASAAGHPNRVMVSPQQASYHRPDVAETVRDSDSDAESAGRAATCDRNRSIEASADV